MSDAEDELSFQLRAAKIDGWVTEHRFAPPRRWRFDFAFLAEMLAVEVEGITFFGKNKDGSMKLGRHQTAEGMEADLEKYQEAMLLGWKVYRVSPKMIKSGRALLTIEMLLARKQT